MAGMLAAEERSLGEAKVGAVKVAQSASTSVSCSKTAMASFSGVHSFEADDDDGSGLLIKSALTTALSPSSRHATCSLVFARSSLAASWTTHPALSRSHAFRSPR